MVRCIDSPACRFPGPEVRGGCSAEHASPWRCGPSRLTSGLACRGAGRDRRPGRHRRDLRLALRASTLRLVAERHGDAVHGRGRHLCHVLVMPGIRLVGPAVGVGHDHARLAALRPHSTLVPGATQASGTVAQDHESDHGRADVPARRAVLRRAGTGERGRPGMGGPTVERFRRHLRPRWVRLRHRQGRYPDRPVGPSISRFRSDSPTTSGRD